MMDKECVRLCDAINKIVGLSTDSSCSGHGKAPLRVWFDVHNPTGLMVLARAIDNRYGGPPRMAGKEWFIEVHCTDVLPGYTYLLASSSCGLDAYNWADRIADNIEDTLSRDNVVSHYKLCPRGALDVWEEAIA